MTWTMFEFGKRRGQVSERDAEVAQAEENLAHLKNRVRIDGPQGAAMVELILDVTEPLPRWQAQWFWIAMPLSATTSSA